MLDRRVGGVRIELVMLAPGLAVAIVLGYAASLWWLLRREATTTWVALAALCGLSLVLRLVYTTDYPAGFNEDEPRMVWCVAEPLAHGKLFGENCGKMPYLLQALFQTQLVPILGPNRWAIRSYSHVTSVLATLAAFALARGFRLRVLSSLAVSAFVVVLPWSIFYGRISTVGTGQMVFHQLLLLAALARLLWQTGGWVEVAIGAFGLCLLLYDYYAGRVMLAMPVWVALLTRGRSRLLCLAVVVMALVSWAPYLSQLPSTPFGGSEGGYQYHPGFSDHPLQTLMAKTGQELYALTAPVGADGFFCIAAGAMHPTLILVLAVIGALTGVRRGLFLWGGFFGGLVPAIVSTGDLANSHRMMMAYPFIALAAGCAFDLITYRTLRVVVTAMAVSIVGFQSVRFYFSPEFWLENSRYTFGADKTGLVDALPLPPHPRLIIVRQIGYWFATRMLVAPSVELLAAENWYPPNHDAALYAFTGELTALRPFYEELFGPQRVQVFGSAFLVTLEPRDWSWLRQHGWTYERSCGGKVWRGQVPTLFHLLMSFEEVHFGLAAHVWRGRWNGPSTQLRLRFHGAVTVDTSQGRVVDVKGPDGAADFAAEHDSAITITLTSDDSLATAWLMELTPAGERIPPWDYVTPIP